MEMKQYTVDQLLTTFIGDIKPKIHEESGKENLINLITHIRTTEIMVYDLIQAAKHAKDNDMGTIVQATAAVDALNDLNYMLSEAIYDIEGELGKGDD